MMPSFRNCDFCRHSVRIQHGPHAWRHDCRLKQTAFPDADECAFYAPPPSAEGREIGLGYIWDSEYEGAP